MPGHLARRGGFRLLDRPLRAAKAPANRVARPHRSAIKFKTSDMTMCSSSSRVRWPLTSTSDRAQVSEQVCTARCRPVASALGADRWPGWPCNRPRQLGDRAVARKSDAGLAETRPWPSPGRFAGCKSFAPGSEPGRQGFGAHKESVASSTLSRRPRDFEQGRDGPAAAPGQSQHQLQARAHGSHAPVARRWRSHRGARVGDARQQAYDEDSVRTWREA